jgi:hypothetical protein
VNRRSVVSRRGHRVDLLDQDGRTEGVSVTTADGGLRLVLDAVTTTVTVHSDGTVLVEGAKGVAVDAGSAALDLKGGQVTLSGSTGVTIDSGGSLSLKGTTATLEGSTQTDVKGGGLCTVSAGLVRIN